ncbi:MAG: response regulator [Pseudomonadales bacterium]
MSNSSDRAYLTPNEVAELFSVSPVTVRQWSQKGLLDAETTAGGHRRYSRAALSRFAEARGMKPPFPGSNRLLIVDDNQQFNEFLKVLFTTECRDVEVACAYDGFEAGRLVQQFEPAVVLLDIMMPGLDGIEVCRRLKADSLTQSIRVLGMTGHYSAELAHRMLEAGAETLLKKPFSKDAIIAACGFEALDSTVESANKNEAAATRSPN